MITSETYHNVYVYASRRLWIAYSIAATSAIAAVIIGMYTIVVTGASYSDDFSTILRVSRHAHLDNEVAVADGNGRDPLPEYLANTTITVARDAEIGEEGPAFTERDTTTTTSSQRLLSGEDQPSSA